VSEKKKEVKTEKILTVTVEWDGEKETRKYHGCNDYLLIDCVDCLVIKFSDVVVPNNAVLGIESLVWKVSPPDTGTEWRLCENYRNWKVKSSG